jgi:hypothetical protein
MVAHQKKTYSWEFSYMGTNQDAIEVAASLGIPAECSVTYHPNEAGARAVMQSLIVGVANFRGGAAMANNQASYADAYADGERPKGTKG